jgi:tripartite-type tricarboxylate transporter receptor subunit TctC
MVRRSLIAAFAGLMLAWASTPLQAQSNPEKTIKLIVPAPPGGQTDVLARYLGQRLQAALGQNVIIANRAGAGGAIGARAAATAEPHGYTLLFGNTSTLAVIPAVSKNAGYDPVRNFAPIASVSESYMILVVHPDFPAKTLPEFIAYAKANPGKLNFGNADAGNVTHLTGEMLRAATGIQFVNVPRRGGAESITALLGRQVDFVLESPVVLLPLIREGKLRGLAVTSAQRKPEIADIPTVREGGADFVATLLTGVVAPAGTPAAAIARLNAVINDSLKTHDMQETLVKFGSEPKVTAPEEFAACWLARRRSGPTWRRRLTCRSIDPLFVAATSHEVRR